MKEHRFLNPFQKYHFQQTLSGHKSVFCNIIVRFTNLQIITKFDSTYFEMIFCGKQLPNLVTTQSKFGEFCMYVDNRQSINSSSSCGWSFSKHDTLSPRRHLIALDLCQILHVEPISTQTHFIFKFFFSFFFSLVIVLTEYFWIFFRIHHET